MNKIIFDNITDEIWKERKRQFKRFGEQNHGLSIWMTILMEEVGEAAKEVNDINDKLLRKELIQVAAVAVAYIESLDRNELK